MRISSNPRDFCHIETVNLHCYSFVFSFLLTLFSLKTKILRLIYSSISITLSSVAILPAEKHGTCSSPVVHDEYNYFLTTLNIFMKYNVTVRFYSESIFTNPLPCFFFALGYSLIIGRSSKSKKLVSSIAVTNHVYLSQLLTFLI